VGQGLLLWLVKQGHQHNGKGPPLYYTTENDVGIKTKKEEEKQTKPKYEIRERWTMTTATRGTLLFPCVCFV
jgi:hypothetical protein